MIPRIKKIWVGFVDLSYKISVLVSFLSILPLMVFIIFKFYYFDPSAIIVGGLSLVLTIHVNKELNGKRGS